MNAMILAAGRGERLRPITDRLPKPLVEINGVSLLERHLQRLAAAGVGHVVINLGWLGERIVDRIGSGAAFGLQVSYSPEYDQILDTGGGIRRALPMLGEEPFWVINGDILTDFEIAAPSLADEIDAHLVLVENPAHRSQGDFGLIDGRVLNAAQPSFTYSGIACYRPAFFAGLPVERFSVVPLLRAAADQRRLSGQLFGGFWADVGTPQRLAELGDGI